MQFINKNEWTEGAWLVQLEEHENFGLGVVSLSLMFGAEITKKSKLKKTVDVLLWLRKYALMMILVITRCIFTNF